MIAPNDTMRETVHSRVLEIPLFYGLVELAGIIWRRKHLILVSILVLLGVAFLFCFVSPPSYESSSQILVERKRPRSIPMPGADPRLAYFQDSLSPHQTLLTSRLIAERAIAQGNLTSLATFQEQTKPQEESSGFSLGMLFSWFPDFGRTTKPQPFDPAKVLMQGLEVSRETKDAVLEDRSIAIFNISFASMNEEDSAKVVEAVTGAYTSYLDENHDRDSDDIRALYGEWKGELQVQLEERERLYAEKLDGIQPLQWQSSGGLNISEKRVEEISNQRLSMLVQLAHDKERLAALNAAKEEGVSHQVLFDLVATWTSSPDDHPGARDQLFDLLMQEKRLEKVYGEQHREVRALREQLKILARHVFGPNVDVEQLKLMDPVEVYARSLERNVTVMQATAEELGKLIEAEHAKAKDAHVLNEKLVQLRADLELVRAMQKQVVNQLQEVNVLSDSDYVRIHILEPPSPAALTLISKPLVVFAVLGLIGAVLGSCWAMLAETLNRRFRTPRELESRLQVPVLGHVPYARVRRSIKRRLRDGKQRLSPLLITAHDPESPESEAYREVRTALFCKSDRQGARVIQVTSPRVGEGKSVFAANLAISIARSGRRVILIDGDFRRPALAQLFGLPTEVGLVNVLAEDVDLEDAVHASEQQGLDVLTSEATHDLPQELVTSPRIAELVGYIRQKYDFAIIDSPPVLALSDPSALAVHVDGVVLTMRNSRKAQVVALRALERLRAVDADVLGVVVKAAKWRRGSGRFGYDDDQGWLDYRGYRRQSHVNGREVKQTPSLVKES